MMRCIFCKSDTRDSASIEHIMPESLGNIEHILPRGWVCDGCNNYFARKVEKPFLDSLFATSTRSIMGVPNKRGRVLPMQALHPQSRSILELFRCEDRWIVGAASGEDETAWIRSIRNSQGGSFWLPTPTDIPEANVHTARFIGKIALEALAAQCKDIEGWNAELVNHPTFDPLRNYVRLGVPAITWPVSIRRIYEREHRFNDHAFEDYEILHEWMILATDGGEYYCVIAIFGVEFAINLGGPQLDGWNAWLIAHDMRSPLLDAPSRESGGAGK